MTTALPRVHCLMCTYGRFSLVRRALAGFLRQDYPNAHLHILNNHPTPIEIDPALAGKVTVYNLPGQPTLGACRSLLFETVNPGDDELVRTWDDDDLYLPWTVSQGAAMHLWFRCDAVKPKRSWFCDGTGAKRTWRLVENAMEASITFRASYVRRNGYADSGGDEHAPLLANLDGNLATHDFGPLTGYVYTWGQGCWHISGSLGAAPIEARTADWKARNTDDGGGQALTPDYDALDAMLDSLRSAATADYGPHLDRRLRNEPVSAYRDEDCEKYEGFRSLISYAEAMTDDLCRYTVLEFGRLRNDSEDGRRGDGWSTHAFATDQRVSEILSVDTDEGTRETCQRVIPEHLLRRCRFARSFGELGPVTDVMRRTGDHALVSVLLLDADDDPVQHLLLLREVWPYLRADCLVAVDDFRFGVKHLLVRAFLEGSRHAVRIADMIVFHV